MIRLVDLLKLGEEGGPAGAIVRLGGKMPRAVPSMKAQPCRLTDQKSRSQRRPFGDIGRAECCLPSFGEDGEATQRRCGDAKIAQILVEKFHERRELPACRAVQPRLDAVPEDPARRKKGCVAAAVAKCSDHGVEAGVAGPGVIAQGRPQRVRQC